MNSKNSGKKILEEFTMKKALSLILALALCIGVFAACAPVITKVTLETPTEVAPAEVVTPIETAETSAIPADAVDTSLQKVIDSKTFILGLDDAFPPMGYRDEQNNIVGFDVDLAVEAWKRIDPSVTVVFQPIEWSAKEIELNAGNIDCIWNGMTDTPARRESMNLSLDYLSNSQCFLVLKDSPIKTKADLAGKTVAVQAGSSAVDAIDEEPELKASFAKLLDLTDNVKGIFELKNGTIDALAADESLIGYYVADDSALRILDEKLWAEEYAIGFRKADVALTNAINDALRAMNADGTVAKIAEKYKIGVASVIIK